MKVIKKKKLNKKGIEITMSTIMIMIIVMVATLVILVIFYKFMGEGRNDTETVIGDVRTDCDNDGINNIIDNCPCEGDQNPETCQKNIRSEQCNCVD